MRTAPDGKPAWLVVAATFSVYMWSVGLQYCTGIFYRAWKKSSMFDGTPPANLAWATSLEGCFFLLGSLVAGKLIVRLRESVTILIGALVILAGSFIAAFVETTDVGGSLAILYAFFGVLLGTGCALVHQAAIVAVQKFFIKRRSLATGITVAGSGVGGFVLAPVLEDLVNSSGWRVALAVYGGVTCGVCVLAAVVMDVVKLESPAPVEVGSVSAPATPNDGTALDKPGAEPAWTAEPPPAGGWSYSNLARSRFFLTYSAFIVFFGLCWFTAPTFLPVTVTEQLGGTSVDVSAVVAVQGVANTVGRVLLGMLADAFPRRKLLLLSSCMLLVTASSIAFALARSLPFAYVHAAFLGGFGGALISIQPAVVIDELGLAALPLVAGALNGIQAPFALAGPPIGGAIRAASTDYGGTWGFVAASFVVALLLSLCVGQRGPWVAAYLPASPCSGGKEASSAVAVPSESREGSSEQPPPDRVGCSASTAADLESPGTGDGPCRSITESV